MNEGKNKEAFYGNNILLLMGAILFNFPQDRFSMPKLENLF
jgi:hypothetical protein